MHLLLQAINSSFIPFNVSAIPADVKSTLPKYMRNSPVADPDPNTFAFWEHEWTQHGQYTGVQLQPWHELLLDLSQQHSHRSEGTSRCDIDPHANAPLQLRIPPSVASVLGLRDLWFHSTSPLPFSVTLMWPMYPAVVSQSMRMVGCKWLDAQRHRTCMGLAWRCSRRSVPGGGGFTTVVAARHRAMDVVVALQHASPQFGTKEQIAVSLRYGAACMTVGERQA